MGQKNSLPKMQDATAQSREAQLRRLIDALQQGGEAAAPDVVRYLHAELERQSETDQRLEELFRTAEIARDEVRESREQNQAKDRFLAVLSHELRTPLQPVLSAATALLRDPRIPADLLEQVRTIQRNIQLEARLIDDLLDLTKITTGKLTLEKHPVNLHSVIPRVVEICEEGAIAKKLTLSTAFKSTRPWVSADPGRVQQILWNLVKNAVKFTPAGGSVTIHTSTAGEQLIVEVIDTGIGIEGKVLARIFDAFEQGDPTITRQFGGLGLGLAISKVLAERHEGVLEAFSDGPGLGATFRLTLPTIEGPAKPSPGAHGNYPAKPTRVLNILLVEDDVDTAFIMSRLLATIKHTVATANSCRSALAAAEDGEFDLLLCDLGLPDGSGLDIVGEIKALLPNLKAIALTGYGAAEDIQRSTDAGFDAHLTKPTTLDQIVGTIDRLLR